MSIIICVVVPVISVVGGAVARWMRDAAFWIAIAATSTMPVAMIAPSSAALNGPSTIASAAPRASSRNSSVSIVRRTGSPTRGSANASMRVTMMTAQNTGNASSLASVPELPNTADAPMVTKLPVTWAVNRPCSARKPAVSTTPALRLMTTGRVSFKANFSWQG